MMTNSIFKLYKSNRNTMFSKLSNKDIDSLLKFLEDYYIRYQNKLNISNTYSFGFEFEFEDSDRISIMREIYRKWLYPSYQVKEEDTVRNGGEISTPILHNIKTDWKKVRDVLDIISRNGYNGENCGGHIHIGSHIMNYRRENWENFFMIWSLYENIITRFLNGEYINTRLTASKYAPPVAGIFKEAVLDNKLIDIEKNMDISFNNISVDRYQSVNLNGVSNVYLETLNDTLEFRSPNGTFNPVIWQNNLNMILHLLLSTLNLDHELLLEQIKKHNIDISNYSNIDIIKALEFCDIIFNNNLDKINFLRQYFKDYNETSERVLVKSKPFTL